MMANGARNLRGQNFDVTSAKCATYLPCMTVLVALPSVRSVRQPGHWLRSPTVGFGRA